MPERTKIEEEREEILRIIYRLRESFDEVMQLVREISYVQPAKEITDLIQSFRDLRIELLAGRITAEDARKRLLELIEKSKELEDKLKTLSEKTGEVTKEQVDVFREFHASLVHLTTRVKETTDRMGLLERGIPIEGLGGLGRTVGSVSRVLSRFLGITVPLTVADMLKQVADLINKWSAEITATFSNFAFGMMGSFDLSRQELLALGRYLDALGYQLMLSRRDIESFIVHFRTSGLMFTTDLGMYLADMQKSFAQGRITVEEFARGIGEVITPMRELSLALGMTLDQLVRTMVEWRRLLMTRDIEEVSKAITWLYTSAKDLGADFNMLIDITRQVVSTTRLYGIDLWRLTGVVKDFSDLISDGVIKVQDFTNALVRGREQVSADKHGTLLYFLANYGTSEEVRQIAQRFLSKGVEGVYEYSLFITTQVETLRRIYDKLPEESRRFIDTFAEHTGLMRQGAIDWERWARLQLEMRDEAFRTLQSFSRRFGETGIQFAVLMELLNTTGVGAVGTLQDLVIQQTITSKVAEGTTRALEEKALAERRLTDILSDSKKQLDEFTDVLKDVNKVLREFQANIFLMTEEMQRRIPTERPFVAPPPVPPELSKEIKFER